MRSSFAAKADAFALAMTIKEATLAESVFAFAFTFLLGFGWFPSAWGSACPGSQHPFPCAVETCTAPSKTPWPLQDFALRAVNPGLWWSWRDLHPRPAPTYFNICKEFHPATTIPLRADESPSCFSSGMLTAGFRAFWAGSVATNQHTRWPVVIGQSGRCSHGAV